MKALIKYFTSNGIRFKLSSAGLQYEADYGESVTLAGLRRVFKRSATQWMPERLLTSTGTTRPAWLEGKRLTVGCSRFSYAHTALIKQWATKAKKASPRRLALAARRRRTH